MTIESSYCRYVRLEVLVPCFPKVLQLVKNLNGEVASEDSRSNEDALDALHLDNGVYLSANELGVLL